MSEDYNNVYKTSHKKDFISDESIEELVEFGVDYFRKEKKNLFSRGFIMGVLTAVSIYSIIIILVLLG